MPRHNTAVRISANRDYSFWCTCKTCKAYDHLRFTEAERIALTHALQHGGSYLGVA